MITLTTAGLGDYTPTTPASRLICSVFIYVGVAVIGLLLGSLLARFVKQIMLLLFSLCLVSNFYLSRLRFDFTFVGS